MYSTCRTYSVAVKAHKYAAETKDLSKDEFEVYCKEHREEMDKDFNGLNKANETFSLDLQYFQELVFRLSRSDLRDVSQLIQSKGGDKTAVYTYAYKLYSDRDYLRNAQNAYADADFKKLFKLRSALTDFALKMQEQYQKLAGISKMIDTEIDAIIPKLNDIEQEMNLGGFIPDANGTLRFTYGYIKGYSPEDAIWFSPFTTVAGILEKSEGSNNPDYYLQDEFITKMKTIEPADVLRHPTENQVVVALLYNMDTTGGNSGSPILDAHGNIIGINFDRAYTATINDYAWNELYSRSIGVDIRYVLYIM
jgi:hypothetical protein